LAFILQAPHNLNQLAEPHRAAPLQIWARPNLSAKRTQILVAEHPYYTSENENCKAVLPAIYAPSPKSLPGALPFAPVGERGYARAARFDHIKSGQIRSDLVKFQSRI
jgi:hypothetical protein